MPADEETAVERVARERVEALEDLAWVAAHLELPEGRGPTPAEYDGLREELIAAGEDVLTFSRRHRRSTGACTIL